ncbi:bifunctional phosphopantothenoylcysteine decarboxylase/phosphopantothenate--cysteine ligase CoaBC [Thermogemmatispora sp.]|uniref:bifunctional phosphopantothenoylcysteine decarboxylase/phosphopantothenate--cysteine ligase CoaBC n=1 Tax=Thermogemmatispora sp. TaxID=1968838 RepID=UPI001D34E1DA|nr:bifunctional phosphopantothenoylcysteine decarboxylase/phosphopantothenate--cysteine ligase CoaBC [Thermogemmatispora sp.]MBX5451186.1 bifunctional phosphopantothenoylcysteine decarboxylase/phosphopantothenate--cysteine ligase CoaBC [Thermogemmatispora sp.]
MSERASGRATGKVLLNRRIIVGVCGGIACYKAADLVSKLQQAGALVDVIMTERAEEFVRPLTFAALSHRPVYSDLWQAAEHAAELHIELARAAELLAIVPATANTLAKLAHGIADNLLTAVALATRAPLLLAPAMDAEMYEHPATQANLALLRERGAHIVPPEVGHLASGAIGPGRLPETAHLLGAVRWLLGRTGDLAGRRVVVTAGGTREPLDPVRFLGNRSSGKMGFALAAEALARGAQVRLISAPTALTPPYGAEFEEVETALQMLEAVRNAVATADVLVMNAAVADFRPATPVPRKIKKEELGSHASEEAGAPVQAKEELTLRLVRNPDILQELAHLSAVPTEPQATALTQQASDAARSAEVSGASLSRSSDRSARPHRLIRVGFAAETHDVLSYARQKLAQKGLDLLVANDITRPDSGFGSDTNKVYICHADGGLEELPVMPKEEVAAAIWDRIVPLLGTN